jgi:hypothetical protein
LDTCGFDEYQTRSLEGIVAESGNVIIGQCADRRAFRCRAVLTHRRYEDAISECGSTNSEGREESWDRDIFFAFGEKRARGDDVLGSEIR